MSKEKCKHIIKRKRVRSINKLDTEDRQCSLGSVLGGYCARHYDINREEESDLNE